MMVADLFLSIGTYNDHCKLAGHSIIKIGSPFYSINCLPMEMYSEVPNLIIYVPTLLGNDRHMIDR